MPETQLVAPDTIRSSELFPELRDTIENAADLMVVTTMFCRHLKTYGPYNDYYDFEMGRSPDIWFVRIRNATEVIATVADKISLYPFTVSHDAFVSLYRPEHSQGDLLQKIPRQDFVLADVNSDQHQIPFTAAEIRLYMGILHGVDPTVYLKEITANLTRAMSINPQATWEGMVAFGIDLLLPNLPDLTLATCDQIGLQLEQWTEQQSAEADGIEFFIMTLEKCGVIKRNEHETEFEFWIKLTQLLPGLQEYIRYDLPKNSIQEPEYYMQIVLALSYFGLHRRLQFSENNETIAAIAVRRSTGTIIASRINEPIPDSDEHVHAEELIVKQIQDDNDGPETDFSDIDIYVSCVPCDKKCGPLLSKLNLHGIFTGPETSDGPGTVERFSRNQNSQIVYQINILRKKFDELFTQRLNWDGFVTSE